MVRVNTAVTSALARAGDLTAALATTESLIDVVSIRDQASAIKDAFAKVHEAVETINPYAELKIRAERRAGDLLLDRARNKGGRPQKITPDIVSGVLPAKTYEQLEIPARQARRWQAIARIPAEAFERHIASVKDEGEELTTSGVLRLARSLNPKRANRPSCRNGTATMTTEEVEALRSENSQTMTVSVQTVAVCGRQVIITDDRGSLVLECTSKPKASKLAIALREAIAKKPVRIELLPLGINAGKDTRD